MIIAKCNDDELELELHGLSSTILTELSVIMAELLDELAENDAQKKAFVDLLFANFRRVYLDE